jgi:predicted MPP superfamily phosphohydrolase
MSQWLVFTVFLLLMLTVFGLVHWFLYARFVTALQLTSVTILWLLRGLAVFLAVSYILAHWLMSAAPGRFALAFNGFASTWMGFALYLFGLSVVLWILVLPLRWTGVWEMWSPHHAVINRVALIGVCALAILLGGWGMVEAQFPARIVHVRVPVKAINAELRQMKIALVADFHAGATVGLRQVNRWVGEINRLKPDLILIPGDIFDHPPEEASPLVESFRRLKAPMGVFASTGNHEYYAGLNKVLKALEASGIRVLMNEHIMLPDGLVIAAVEDRTALQWKRVIPPIGEILGEEAKTHPTIVMNHTPNVAWTRRAISAGADLVVSAHTHGGQMWPVSIITDLTYAEHHGLLSVGNGFLLTTGGIGYWGPPMRLGVPPEIMMIELVGKDEPADIKWQ